MSAHFVSRTLRALGHDPRIIPAIQGSPDYGKGFSPASMDCFARNSALSAALDPATDDLLFDIVINPWRAGASPSASRAPIRAPAHRHLSLVWVDFVSMLRMMLRLRSAEKSKKSSEISRVTLSPMESGFLFCLLAVAKSGRVKLARTAFRLGTIARGTRAGDPVSQSRRCLRISRRKQTLLLPRDATFSPTRCFSDAVFNFFRHCGHKETVDIARHAA